MLDQKVTGNFPTLEPPFIRAEIHGDDRCAAEGITIVARAPVLGICRKLIEAGTIRPRHLKHGAATSSHCASARSVTARR